MIGNHTTDGDGDYEYQEAFLAHECPNGHLSYPGHELCPDCGEPQTTTHDLSDRIGRIATWTTSTATPPGVREPNHLAVVEFDLAGTSVRALGQLTTGEVAIGDAVRPVRVDELREPGAGIREAASQRWDGYRFEPVEE
jgi:uncharacterized OB-fold protein